MNNLLHGQYHLTFQKLFREIRVYWSPPVKYYLTLCNCHLVSHIVKTTSSFEQPNVKKK